MQGLRKAVTFSFDDGNESDKRLIELLDKYNLKCSFNLNSGLFDKTDTWMYNDCFEVRKLIPFDTAYYKKHEVCVHGLLHRAAVELDDRELYREFYEDKQRLELLFGYPVVGAAYAYGVYDDRVVEQLRNIGLKYCRTVEATDSFDLQTDMLRYKPTCHFRDADVFDKIDRFLELSSDKPQIMYIWGHSYEADGDSCWVRLETIFKRLANHDDIYYGTNTEVFRYMGMIE